MSPSIKAGKFKGRISKEIQKNVSGVPGNGDEPTANISNNFHLQKKLVEGTAKRQALQSLTYE